MLCIKANILKICVTMSQAREFNPTAQGFGLIVFILPTGQYEKSPCLVMQVGILSTYLFTLKGIRSSVIRYPRPESSLNNRNDYIRNNVMILNFFYLYRHDLKIYASDEGRVQMTAAAFAKGSGLPDDLLWGISVTLFIFKML